MMQMPPNGRQGFAQPMQQSVQGKGGGMPQNPYTPNTGQQPFTVQGFNPNSGAGRFLQGQMYQPAPFRPMTYQAQQTPNIGTLLSNIAAAQQFRGPSPADMQAGVGVGSGVDGTGVGIGVDGGNGSGGPAQGGVSGGPGEGDGTSGADGGGGGGGGK